MSSIWLLRLTRPTISDVLRRSRCLSARSAKQMAAAPTSDKAQRRMADIGSLGDVAAPHPKDRTATAPPLRQHRSRFHKPHTAPAFHDPKEHGPASKGPNDPPLTSPRPPRQPRRECSSSTPLPPATSRPSQDFPHARCDVPALLKGPSSAPTTTRSLMRVPTPRCVLVGRPSSTNVLPDAEPTNTRR